MRQFLNYRLLVSERQAKAENSDYCETTINNALGKAEEIARERVGRTMAIARIVRLVPRGQRQETTFRVTGEEGWVLEVGSRSLLDSRRMREAVMLEAGQLPAEVKKQDWEEHVGWALATQSEEEQLPSEVSFAGFLKDMVEAEAKRAPEYLSLASAEEGAETVEPMFPHRNERGEIVVRFREMMARVCAGLELGRPTPNQLGAALRALRFRRTQRRFGGERVNVWVVPVASLHEEDANEEAASDSGCDGCDECDIEDDPPRLCDGALSHPGEVRS